MKKIKRSMSVIISIVMIVFMLSFSTANAEDTIMFSGGNGTEESPYLISTADDLFKLSELINSDETSDFYRNKRYIQTNDIDLNNVNFTPIGTYTETNTGKGFYGVYDGNYHKISGLYVNRETKGNKVVGSYNGLFGWCYSGVIKNLSVYGNIICLDSYQCGGIVGELGNNAIIENCSFSGCVYGHSNVGGLVGIVWRRGIIKNSFSNVDVKAISSDASVGGIVGKAIVGYDEVIEQIELNNCYSVGVINSIESTKVGGIVGDEVFNNTESTITFKNCCYLSTMADGAVQNQKEEGCYRLAEKALKNCADGSLLSTPFVNNARTDNFNDGFPVFEWQNYILFNGSGTEDDPYQINNKEELKRMRDYVNSEYLNAKFGAAYYIQLNDIDLENEEWNPIGKREIGNTYDNSICFRGNYNGNERRIINLKICQGSTKEHFFGLFGYIYHGGTVKNLEVHGNISNESDSNGGIAGELGRDGYIENCCFFGDVSGSSAVGGIVGNTFDAVNIKNCYHNGVITLIDIEEFRNTYSQGSGGIIGHSSVGNSSSCVLNIENCYHVGKINGIDGKAGSIIGVSKIRNKGGKINIKNCYVLHDDCLATINGDITEKDILVYSSSVFRIIAEDISSEFITNEDKNFNNGYPIFYWQAESKNSGDINNDGQINVADAVLLQKHILNIAPIKKEQAFAADINQDNVIDVFDMISLRKMLLENKDR